MVAGRDVPFLSYPALPLHAACGTQAQSSSSLSHCDTGSLSSCHLTPGALKAAPTVSSVSLSRLKPSKLNLFSPPRLTHSNNCQLLSLECAPFTPWPTRPSLPACLSTPTVSPSRLWPGPFDSMLPGTLLLIFQDLTQMPLLSPSSTLGLGLHSGTRPSCGP